MGWRPSRAETRSGWVVGLIALAGGLIVPMSMPLTRAPATTHVAAGGATASTADTQAVGAQLAHDLAQPGADTELAAFYAARDHRPLWIADGRMAPEASQLIRRVRDARSDGLDPADYRADDLQAAVDAARSGRPDDLAAAEIALSQTLASWGADLHRVRPAADVLYSDPQFRPPGLTRQAALDAVAKAPSLKAGLDQVARMNPVYTRLRAALQAQPDGPDAPVVRANLERARALPVDLGARYILVDIAAQRLWMYQDGRPVDSMKVVVGKPSDPTPSMAALVRYAVFRPYWNVPPDLVAQRMAPKVMKQGMGYFRGQHLQALNSWNDNAKPMDPSRVNWRAVASGRVTLRVRQLPGPGNMMGQVKFMFPNQKGVYLHDSPLRAFFSGEERLASAGCVRLEDAPRLGRWLLGDAVVQQGEQPGPPETRADLSQPVPVYLAYLTAIGTRDGVSLRKDIYHRDAALIAQLDRPRGAQFASR